MKKLIAITLAVATILTVAPSVNAQSVSDLQAQIALLQQQLAALMGGTGSTGSLVSCTFTRALAPGMSGEDVRCLQRFLNSAGHMVATTGAGSPGMESMTYGPRTQAAVAAWQAARGLACAPYCGYFGPMSMTAYNAQMAGTPGTGTPGTGTSVGLTGTANIKAVRTLSQYSNESVGEGENDVIVLGKEIEMDSTGNARIQQVRIKLDGSAISSPASNRIERYLNDATVMVNGKEVGTVSASSFSRESTGVYTATVILNNSAMLNSGAKNELTLAISGVSNLDSNDENQAWTVNFESLRFVDGTGAIIIENGTTLMTSTTVTFEDLASSADLKLRLNSTSSHPKATSQEASTTTDTKNVVLAEFTLRAQGSQIWVDEIPVLFTVTSAGGVAEVDDVIARAMLKVGNSTFSEVLPTSGTGTNCDDEATCTVTFTDLDYTLGKDQSVTVQVVVDVKKLTGSEFIAGTKLKADISSTQRDAIVSEDSNGDNVSNSNKTGVVTGEFQQFFTEGIHASNFLVTYDSTQNDSGQYISQTYNVSFDVTAFGNTFYLPKTSAQDSSSTAGVVYSVLTGGSVTTGTTEAASLVSSTNATTSGDRFEIPEGSTRRFTVTVSLTGGGAAFNKVRLVGVGYSTVNTGGTVEYYAPVPVESFETAERQIQA